MKKTREPTEILETIYNTAVKEIEKDNGKFFLNSLETEQRNWLINIERKAESLKAVVTVLATCLTKKMEDPSQDIRYHKEELKGGYSGRTFDTKYVTPFFKEKFRRLAMKESGWLTRSIEQPSPFTLNFPGKIRDKNVKDSFLQILNDIEEKKANPQTYLTALFIFLIRRTDISLTTVRSPAVSKSRKIPIDKIIECLILHFSKGYSVSGASRLPVIAIYSIYEILMKDVPRYQNKRLLPLRSHTTSDLRAKGIGDIEIVDERRKYFEGVEVKFDIPIDATLINDAYDKFKNIPITRYYLLTTAEPNIRRKEKRKIKLLLEEIRNEHGCEVIVNGIVPSLKYYLRLLKEPAKFLERYSKNLFAEFSKTSDIKEEHIKKWKIIIGQILRKQ